MDSYLADIAALALVAALSPFPIIAIVPVLSAARGVPRGATFVLGWAVGLAVAMGAAIVVVTASGADPTDASGPASWVSIVRVLIGVLLVGYSITSWIGRPRAGEPVTSPGWIAALETTRTRRLATVGVAISALNPKIILLAVGAATATVQANVPSDDTLLAIALFVAIGSLGALTPLLVLLLAGDRAERLLAAIRTWMERHGSTLVTLLFLLIGVKLVVDGIRGLTL